MTVSQTELDSFHTFATHVIAQSGSKLSLEDLIQQWYAEREREETLASIRRGVADADAGRVRDIGDVDAEIRSALGFPARG
jgi:predicted transcriptional regulator